MAQYTKEIKLTTPNSEFLKTITGNYEVIFDKIMNDLENRDLQVFEPMIKFTPISEQWDG